METKPVYKRVLLKISGESLAGEKKTGIDFDIVRSVCTAVKTVVDMGVEVGIVVGGGNFWRGVKDGGGKMERTRADHMGMMATVMNALAVSDVFEQMGVPVRVQTAITMAQIAEPYIRLKADKHLNCGRVVIFGCGTGNPFFSTDTAAVLRAAEEQGIEPGEIRDFRALPGNGLEGVSGTKQRGLRERPAGCGWLLSCLG